MRLPTVTLLPVALVLFQFRRAISAQATSALTLSTFQPINGFSAACTKAYNTPLTDCTNSDFAGQGCSAKCIGFLDSLTNLLTTNCAGTSAYPNTLIGLFFKGNGTHTLCSNAAGSSSSSNGENGYGQGAGQNGAFAIQSAGGQASASTTSTTTTTSSISTSSTSSISSSTPQALATSSTTTVVPITVTPEPTTTSVAVIGTTVTPESASDASTSTSHSKSSTSSSSTSTSTGNGNGGGTPLDVGSSACRDAAVSVWLSAFLAGSAGVIWFI